MRQKVMRELIIKPSQQYAEGLFQAEPSELFTKAKQASDQVGKTSISLSSGEARLLSVLIRSHACKKFVEIGTLTGYSALWAMEGLADGGELWTLEKDPQHASLAGSIFEEYNAQEAKKKNGKKIHLVVGDAREELNKISSEGPFDGIFIDGNKAAYGDYLDWAEKNVRAGGLILADNVYLGGSVFGQPSLKTISEKQTKIMQDFNKRLADSEKYVSTLIDTHEGLFVAIKKF